MHRTNGGIEHIKDWLQHKRKEGTSLPQTKHAIKVSPSSSSANTMFCTGLVSDKKSSKALVIELVQN